MTASLTAFIWSIEQGTLLCIRKLKKPFFLVFLVEFCFFFRRKKFMMCSTLQPSLHPLFYERRIYGLFQKPSTGNNIPFLGRCWTCWLDFITFFLCQLVLHNSHLVISAKTTDNIISELNENIKHQPGDEILVVFTSTLPQFTIDIFKADDLWPLIFILKAMEIDMKVSKK